MISRPSPITGSSSLATRPTEALSFTRDAVATSEAMSTMSEAPQRQGGGTVKVPVYREPPMSLIRLSVRPAGWCRSRVT